MIVVPVETGGSLPNLVLGLPEKVVGEKVQSGMFYRPLSQMEKVQLRDLAVRGDAEACWNMWVYAWASAKTSADARRAVQWLQRATALEKQSYELQAMKALLRDVEERDLVGDFSQDRDSLSKRLGRETSSGSVQEWEKRH